MCEVIWETHVSDKMLDIVPTFCEQVSAFSMLFYRFPLASPQGNVCIFHAHAPALHC